MKKIISVLLCVLMIIPLSVISFAEEENTSALTLTAKSAILMEISSGKVLFSKNPDEKLPPASITKIMTLLLIYEALEEGKELPIAMKNNIIYYMGPSPAREGRPIGSAGPTTASRMDKYTPSLLDLGLKGMIGKGKRSQAVKEAIIQNGAVYFAAVGGAGALLAQRITKSTVIAYDDLGTEAIRELEVKDFPVIVVIDSEGNNLYETAIEQYKKI